MLTSVFCTVDTVRCKTGRGVAQQRIQPQKIHYSNIFSTLFTDKIHNKTQLANITEIQRSFTLTAANGDLPIEAKMANKLVGYLASMVTS